MNNHSRLFLHLCVLAACCLGSGCAYNVKPRIERVAFAGAGEVSQRIPKKVALVLSDEFVTYDQKLKRGMQPYNYRLGPLLEPYARATAEKFFESVEVARGKNVAPSANADLILTPKVHKSDLTSFVTIFEKQYLTVDVEWTLKRRGEETAIWLSTFEGKGEGKAAKMRSLKVPSLTFGNKRCWDSQSCRHWKPSQNDPNRTPLQLSYLTCFLKSHEAANVQVVWFA
jgi:hypothetical protein